MWPISHTAVVHKEVRKFAEVVVLGSRAGFCFSALIILNLSLQENNLLQLQAIDMNTFHFVRVSS